jgi:UPF0271 protein
MKTADLNCDMGEGIGNDALLMPFIHSANIACGYHAGDVDTMKQTLELCLRHGVKAGAHPSFLDRENFGRREMLLESDEIYDLVSQQLFLLNEIATDMDVKLHHVKPHGALYNMAANNPALARTIALAVKDFDPGLVLLGLSGSVAITEAKKIGLTTASEVFADRSYREDGSLTPRSEPGALLEDTATAVKQVLEMMEKGTVTTVSGKRIPVLAETICIHGDGKLAVELARALYTALGKQ